MALAREMNLSLEPIHLRREDPRIRKADEGSKVADSDDWSIDQLTFAYFEKFFEFTIDLFADHKNAKVGRFYSNFYCEGSLGIEALAHSWERETAWICPPVSLLHQVLRKISSTEVLAGVLIVPNWPTASFWPSIFEPDQTLKKPFVKVEVIRPYIIQNDNARNKALKGYTAAGCLALFIDSEQI